MPTLEAEHYGQDRQRLVNDPIVRDMAEGCRGMRRSEIAHPSGGPRMSFMTAALREYESRAGRHPECHIGGVAEAILLILDEGR